MKDWVVQIQYPEGKVDRVIVRAASGEAAMAVARSRFGGAGTITGYFDVAQLNPADRDAIIKGGGYFDQSGNPAAPEQPAQVGTETPIGTNTQFEQPNIEQEDQFNLEEELPLAAFERGLEQRGYKPEGPLGGLLRKKFPAAQAAFNFNQWLNQSAEDEDQQKSFEGYVAGGPKFYSDARSTFNQLAGGAPLANPFLADAIYRAGVGEEDPKAPFYRSQLGVLGRGAARSKYGMASSWLPSEDVLQRRFDRELYAQAQRGPQAQGISAVDFYKKYFGL